jgi:hypothetical protein
LVRPANSGLDTDQLSFGGGPVLMAGNKSTSSRNAAMDRGEILSPATERSAIDMLNNTLEHMGGVRRRLGLPARRIEAAASDHAAGRIPKSECGFR